MITLSDFKQIDSEVSTNVREVLDFIKTRCRNHNYILLLAEAEYKNYSFGKGYSPYVIDDREDKMRDDTRINFLVEFLRRYYSFPKGTTAINNDTYRIQIELMIYTHVWEAEPFLKKLFRLACLVSEDDYKWQVTVPEMSKHLFIRERIRDAFTAKGLGIGEIIRKGFHTSLRNAFAHSQFAFNNFNQSIQLFTYKGENWDIPNISYDDWAKRFAYSFFLNYHLLNMIHERRLALVQDFKTDKFLIIHPISASGFRVLTVQYDAFGDAFHFVK